MYNTLKSKFINLTNYLFEKENIIITPQLASKIEESMDYIAKDLLSKYTDNYTKLYNLPDTLYEKLCEAFPKKYLFYK